MEVPILYYNYRCHIRHYDDPNLRKIIQLHIQVCEEIGNRECLPVEGDLITLAFECKGEEQFFYDWLNEGAMHNGEIHFIYNEVEIADIFRFWDCFCVKIEEYMSVGNSPMMMVLYLSPGIIKRNNLEVREKVWKVSEDRYRNAKIDEYLLLYEDMDIKAIEAMVDSELEGLAALHNPDQIAGGYVDVVTQMGNKRINSSIGSQWGSIEKGRSLNIENELLKLITDPPPITEEEQKKIKMNVNLVENLEIVK